MVMMMNVKLDDVDDDSGQTVKEKRKGRIEAEDDDDDGDDDALWSGINKNRDVSTGPLARPFALSLAPLTRSVARSLRSLPGLWESELLMSQNDLVLSHSAMV